MLKSFTVAAALTAVFTTTIIDTQMASSTEADSQSVSSSNSVSAPDTVPVIDNHTASAVIAGSIVLFLIRNQRQAVSKSKLSRRLESKLLNRLDRNVAERLVTSAKRSNPGKSEQWYWEKVIYDLNRDRR